MLLGMPPSLGPNSRGTTSEDEDIVSTGNEVVGDGYVRSDPTSDYMSENMRSYYNGGMTIGTMDGSNILNSDFELPAYNDGVMKALLATPPQEPEDKRVPMNLIPYNKKNIDDKFCQSVYRYRHLFCKSAGGTWSDASDVDDFKNELEIMYEQLLKEGRALYEIRILQLAKSMGITRHDKQDCKSWREVMKWALHADNHRSVEIQTETMRKLIELFHIQLDGTGHDFWLQSAVAAWEVKMGVTVETDPTFEGNSIFGRQRSGPCFVRALYKRANLDTYIQTLREKLKRVYNLGFSRRKGCGKDATRYRLVKMEGENVGYIVEYHGMSRLSDTPMLNAGGVTKNAWSGDCLENISTEDQSTMELGKLLRTFRNGLIAHGEHVKAREVARWMEDDLQCTNGHAVGSSGGAQLGTDVDRTMDITEDEVESDVGGEGDEQQTTADDEEVSAECLWWRVIWKAFLI
jgi:hypothetical protein